MDRIPSKQQPDVGKTVEIYKDLKFHCCDLEHVLLHSVKINRFPSVVLDLQRSQFSVVVVVAERKTQENNWKFQNLFMSTPTLQRIHKRIDQI